MLPGRSFLAAKNGNEDLRFGERAFVDSLKRKIERADVGCLLVEILLLPRFHCFVIGPLHVESFPCRLFPSAGC